MEGGGQRGPGARPMKRIPHYALKTVAYSAPDFANQEQDTIRQSFSTGNYTWMKEALPVELGPDAINLLRRQRMERNRLAEPLPQTWTKMTQLWGGGFYQEFEYIPDSYERKHEFEERDRKDKESKWKSLHKSDFRRASQEVKLKHEPLILTAEAFEDPSRKEMFPYLGTYDPSTMPPPKAPLDPTMKDGQLAIEGAFVAGRGKGLDDNGRMSRMRLPTMIKRLQQRLDEDWDDTTVVVSATDQDLVQIAFYMASVDSERGVLAYMNILSKDSELLDDLGLRKVSQLWGMKRDFTKELMGMSRQQPTLESSELDSKGENSLGFLDEEGQSTENPENTWMFFLLSPKWVRMRATDAYYTVHPRAQGSQFRMSTAGSSVLLSLGSSVFDPLDSVQAPGSRGGRAKASTGFGEEQASTSKGVGSGPAGSTKPQKSQTIDLNMMAVAVSGLKTSKKDGD